jgi:hypothetical protein
VKAEVRCLKLVGYNVIDVASDDLAEGELKAKLGSGVKGKLATAIYE